MTRDAREHRQEPSGTDLASSGSLAARLEMLFGPDVDPGISLETEGAVSDFSDEVLRRLATRPDGSGRYRLQGELAHGGMGAILRVWDEDLRRHLAMKVILGGGSTSAGARGGGGRSRNGDGSGSAAAPTPPISRLAVGRFLEEAQVTGQLDHPAIVPVHELGLDGDGRVFFTMKLVKGEDLKAVFTRVHEKQPGWSVTRVLGLLLRACEAMAYAHAKGVIHRDLKPANIMVGRFGEVYVMDWGLARVLDRPDGRDLRLAPESGPDSDTVSSDRSATDRSDSPLVTMDGDVVGTPAYMPPEQARGEIDRLGPASDVYALGAMLYHVLSGRMPYVTPGAYVSPRMVLGLVQYGPPRPLHLLAPRAPAELVAIAERAMQREPEDRYPDMAALADDLRAYLEQRVVSAYRTGALAELRKWMVRNKGLAAALGVVLLLVLAVAGVFAWLNEDLARQRDENLSMSLDLRDRNAELRRTAFERAAALDDATRQRERADLKAAEASAFADKAAANEADAVANEKLALEKSAEARANAEQAQLSEARALANAAEARDNAARARRNRERADAERASVLRLSAFQELQSLQQEVDDLWPATPDLLPRLDRWLARAHALVAGLGPSADGSDAGHRAALVVLRERMRMSGASDRSTEVHPTNDDLWWHAQLTRLIAQIEAFADPVTGLIEGLSPRHGWGVARRRELAARLAEQTLLGAEARRRWSEAGESIADPNRCPAYGGLRLSPQIGLLPLGRDPDSGLWEFWHVASGDEPSRGPDGQLRPGETSGIVLVLIPGGVVLSGAQKVDPAGSHYDPWARPAEGPVRKQTLSAYFLSKYELTQAQWKRFTGSNPSNYGPDNYDPSWNQAGRAWSALHPVERVSWNDCTLTLGRLGLSLPSEAQWEHACRAGGESIWFSGQEPGDLSGFANLADRYGKSHGAASWSVWGQELDDGQSVHAEVGSYRPNDFGLYDMLGNVWEWCLDGDDAVFHARELAGRTSGNAAPASRAFRGGSFDTAPIRSRVSSRRTRSPGNRYFNLGLRPARGLDP